MRCVRRFLPFCVFLLILCCLFGCDSAKKPEVSQKNTLSETVESDQVATDSSGNNRKPLIADLGAVLDTFGESELPDGLIYENETYRIERIGGKCYLSFLEGMVPEKLVSSDCVRHTNSISFQSIDAMFEEFTEKGLQAYSLQQICTFYSQDESGKYRIPDPYHFLIPTISESTLPRDVAVDIGGLNYSFRLPKRGRNNEALILRYSFISKDQYERGVEWIEDYGSIAPACTVSREEDRNATVYSRKSESGHYCKKHYVLQEGNKTVYVSESYWLTRNGAGTSSKTVPSEISVYGTDGTVFYHLSSYALAERPSEEWLLSFGTVPYVPES